MIFFSFFLEERARERERERVGEKVLFSGRKRKRKKKEKEKRKSSPIWNKKKKLSIDSIGGKEGRKTLNALKKALGGGLYYYYYYSFSDFSIMTHEVIRSIFFLFFLSFFFNRESGRKTSIPP